MRNLPKGVLVRDLVEWVWLTDSRHTHRNDEKTTQMSNLEVHVCRKLQTSHVACCGGDLSGRRAGDGGVGSGEICVVEDVKRLGTKHEAVPVCDLRKDLGDGNVLLDILRSKEIVDAVVAEFGVGGQHEGAAGSCRQLRNRAALVPLVSVVRGALIR